MENSFESKEGKVYEEAVKSEKVWIKTATDNDKRLYRQVISRIKELGIVGEVYFADLFNRKILDGRIYDVIEDTVLLWDDKGIEAQLIGAIGRKGNKKAIGKIIEAYEALESEERQKYHAFYDNAVSRVADKKYVDKLLEWGKSWQEVANLPLSMQLLGRWNVEAGKEIFIEQLRSKVDFEAYNPTEYWNRRNQAYINSILALGAYKFRDERIIRELKTVIETTDCVNIKNCATEVMKKSARKGTSGNVEANKDKDNKSFNDIIYKLISGECSLSVATERIAEFPYADFRVPSILCFELQSKFNLYDKQSAEFWREFIFRVSADGITDEIIEFLSENEITAEALAHLDLSDKRLLKLGEKYPEALQTYVVRYYTSGNGAYRSAHATEEVFAQKLSDVKNKEVLNNVLNFYSPDVAEKKNALVKYLESISN